MQFPNQILTAKNAARQSRNPKRCLDQMNRIYRIRLGPNRHRSVLSESCPSCSSCQCLSESDKRRLTGYRSSTSPRPGCEAMQRTGSDCFAIFEPVVDPLAMGRGSRAILLVLSQKLSFFSWINLGLTWINLDWKGVAERDGESRNGES